MTAAHVRPPRPALRVFLDDVRAEPDDDGLRLILADWLTDQETPEDAARAELIRLHVAQRTATRRIGRMHRREQQLTDEWAGAWLGPLASFGRPWQIDRGTVRLTFTGETFYAGEVSAAVGSEAFAWVDGLSLIELTPGATARLVLLPLLAGVRELSFQESRIGNNGLPLLASSPHLGELRVLRLAQAGVGARVGGPLPWHMPHLHTLDLSQNQLWDDTLMHLLTAGLPAVRHLHLGFNSLGNDALERLADSALAAGLRTLDIAGNRAAGDRGLARLAGLPLVRLDASQAAVTEDGMRALGAMTSLEELALNRCELGDSGLKEMIFADGLPRLHTLIAGRALLGDEGLIALFTGPPRPWRRLELAHNHIGPRGVEALAESPDAAALIELNLSGNRLGDAAAFALARSPHLGKLARLDVSDSGLTAAGVAALVRRFGRYAVTA